MEEGGAAAEIAGTAETEPDDLSCHHGRPTAGTTPRQRDLDPRSGTQRPQSVDHPGAMITMCRQWRAT